uniref:Uncharacterized protein n=1 Tax=Anguilla anguilla TaxID=7936 RepID=A0A0E9SRI6_ANGAN
MIRDSSMPSPPWVTANMFRCRPLTHSGFIWAILVVMRAPQSPPCR